LTEGGIRGALIEAGSALQKHRRAGEGNEINQGDVYGLKKKEEGLLCG